MRSWPAIASLALLGCFPDWSSLDPSDADASTTSSAGGSSTGSPGGAGGVGQGAGGAAVGGAGGNGGAGGAEPLGPWSAPEVVAELADPEDDDDPSLTADGLEVYINTRRGGTANKTDIYVSTRPTRDSTWSTPVPVAELNSPQSETNHTVSPDGLTIWFLSARDNPMTGQHLLYRATRPNRNDTFADITVATELQQQGIRDVAGITHDGLTLVGHGTGPGVMTNDMYLLTRASTADPWGTKALIDEVNSPDGESEGWLHPAGIVLMMTSDRMGSLGQADLWTATRASIRDPFEAPFNEMILSSDVQDSDPTMTEDLRYMMFVRPLGPDGEREIYFSER
jgi:WD40-like Beta Propeller Repeat